MSIEFLGGLASYRHKAFFDNDPVEPSEPVARAERGSLIADALSFQRRRNERVLRPLAWFTFLTTAWLFFPRTVFAQKHEYKPVSQLAAKGLTQTPDDALLSKVQAKAGTDRARKNKPTTEVELLTSAEMKQIWGRGPKRNSYFNGVMPWQRSFHDVNVSNGNLFKSFTDMQVAPGRGAGLALQRTYNSNDDRAGAFGVGWTHAYDIRMEEAGVQVDNDVEKEIVPRTDFFGGKHKYVRDADGLYTPPAYMYDEMDSRYDDEMVDGMQRSLEDTQKGMDGTIKHFVPDGTDASGEPSKTRICDYIEDRFGNRTNLTYAQTYTLADGSVKKLLTEVKDPVNRTLNFTWQNFGTAAAPAYRITSVQGPRYTVTYEYYTNPSDTSSYLNLWKVHLDNTGLDRTTTYTYTTCEGETGLLASVVDPLGNTVSYGYTYASRGPVQTINGMSYRAPMSQTPTGTVWVGQITEPAGIDASNNPRTITWTLTPGFRQDYNIAVDLRITNNQVNPPRGKVIFETDAQLRYKSQGFSDSGPNFAGNLGATFVAYDSANNVVKSGQWHGRSYWYLDQHTPEPFTDGFYYHGLAMVNISTYGPHGNVLTQYREGDPTHQTTHTYYDASKYFQKASVTDALGNTSTFDYYDSSDPVVGNRGNVKWVRDAGYGISTSPNYNKQFGYTYNQYGQKTSETNLNGVVTTYAYGDNWGNLTQVVQDPGTGHLNRTTSMEYNTVGNVTSSTDPNGQTSTFTYNTLGQPVTANFPAKSNGTSAETVSYVYQANGRTQSVTDNRGTTTMTYEAGSDRVSSVTDPVTGTIGYRYTPMGARKNLLLPGGGTITYSYISEVTNGGTQADVPWMLLKDDPNSLTERPAHIIDDQNRRVDIAIDHTGLLLATYFNKVYDNGGLVSYCKTTYTYDNTPNSTAEAAPGSYAQIASLNTTFKSLATNQTKLLYKNDYAYNANRQRTSNTITTTNSSNQQVSRTENYTYDELSRLKTANYGDGENQSYTFDAMGNRTAKTDNVTGNETYTYDNANRILKRDSSTIGFGYDHDENGNCLGNGDGDSSQWDSQNRMVYALNEGPDNECLYVYGADGLRRKSSILLGADTRTYYPNPTPRHITHYGYDGTNVVREWSEDSTTNVLSISATYLLGPSGPMYRRPATAADVRWYVYDGLGSVVGEVDVNGTLLAQKKHDVYGLNRGVVGTAASRHGFVGGLGHYSDDETGFIYMRARYYDPALGRFISEDQKGDGSNWYVYCNNDPTDRVDASGNVSTLYVGIVVILMAECGVAVQNWEIAELEGMNAANFGGKMFGDYTTRLLMKKIDWDEKASAASEERMKAEMGQASVNAALAATTETECRKRSILCLITPYMFTAVYFLAVAEE